MTVTIFGLKPMPWLPCFLRPWISRAGDDYGPTVFNALPADTSLSRIRIR
jgi:hypothetical protein